MRAHGRHLNGLVNFGDSSIKRCRLKGETLETESDHDPMLWNVVATNKGGISCQVPSVVGTLVVLGFRREEDAKQTLGHLRHGSYV